MEFVFLFIASALAGIGTGLAGLSAATVMVPILIVFCPSFLGPTGVYQATTVALMSDILASAFTSYIYYKHKNIDLKRGSIMFVCILIMSALGSYVAFLAGNVVLGSFSLFLTFFIGIRFLVKPETGNPEASETKLKKFTLKEILISLFFGITIGFGTGFVGTGGGMMMLVVFTLFLKMGQRTAVGTSTFIMTFTALMAGISHIVIEPEILIDKWQILFFCVAVTAIASIVSARFANYVSERTVGVTTGVILTVLGASMLTLFYWSYLERFPLLVNGIRSFAYYLITLLVYIIIVVLLKKIFDLSKTIFRKLLHLVAVFTPILLFYLSNNTIVTDAILVLFGLGAYLILTIVERNENFSKFFVEKRKGEIKRSLLEFILTALFVVTLTCGIVDRPYILLVTYLVWGIGDAVAGIIGKIYGKKHWNLKIISPKKTVLGSLSMFLVGFCISFIILLNQTAFSIAGTVLISLLVSFVGTFVEAVCRKGQDTVFVPVIVSIFMVVITQLF